jgi:hypothetical protein
MKASIRAGEMDSVIGDLQTERSSYLTGRRRKTAA